MIFPPVLPRLFIAARNAAAAPDVLGTAPKSVIETVSPSLAATFLATAPVPVWIMPISAAPALEIKLAMDDTLQLALVAIPLKLPSICVVVSPVLLAEPRKTGLKLEGGVNDMDNP